MPKVISGGGRLSPKAAAIPPGPHSPTASTTYPGPAYGTQDAQWTGTAPAAACSNTTDLTGKGAYLQLPFNSAGVTLLNDWTSNSSSEPNYGFAVVASLTASAAYKLFDSYNDSNVASSQGGNCTGNCQPYLQLTYNADVAPQVNSMFPPDNTNVPTLTPELLSENLSWLRPTYIDEASGQLMLCIQSYVVRTPHHNILIDSCVGNHKERANYPFWNRMESDRYEKNLAATGLGVNDIDYVMCTHMHVDHVGWNTRLENGSWVPTFPKARYVFADRELAFWTEKERSDPGKQPWIVDSVLPIVEVGKTNAMTVATIAMRISTCLLRRDMPSSLLEDEPRSVEMAAPA